MSTPIIPNIGWTTYLDTVPFSFDVNESFHQKEQNK